MKQLRTFALAAALALAAGCNNHIAGNSDRL